MNDSLPDINERIQLLINHYSEGKRSRFLRLLNDHLKKDQIISQQKFNRIFNIDTRTKKYPNVPKSFFSAIYETFPEVNKTWLLAGEGPMIIDADDKSELQKGEVRDVIELQAMADVLLDYVLKLKAAQPGNSLQKVADEYDTDFELRLRKLRSKK